MNKMAAICFSAFDEIKFFCVVQCFFFSFFFTCVFFLKQLFASGEVIIGEYSPMITSPEANN